MMRRVIPAVAHYGSSKSINVKEEEKEKSLCTKIL